jgi:hypothetical protein
LEPGVNAVIRADLRMYSDGDAWGDTMSAWFSIADVLYVTGEELPNAWKYRQPRSEETVLENMHDPDNGDSLAQDLLLGVGDGTVSANDLRHAGNVLDRYASILTAQGRNY